MKFLTIIIFLSLVSSGYSQFWKSKLKPVSAPVVEVVSKPKPTNSINEAKEIIKEINKELKIAKEENFKLKTNLENANKKVLEANKNTDIVQKNANTLKDWGIEQQNQAFEWMNKYTSTLKRYHRLKNIAAIVAGLFGAMLGMYCMRLVPSIYAAYALALPIAGAVLAFAGVWLFF